MADDLSHYIEKLRHIAYQAGEAILPYFGQLAKTDIQKKHDHTLVTKADLSSHAIIESSLKKYFPQIPVVSEEGDFPSRSDRKNWQELWLIDPLDGTLGFVEGSQNFTINIALIKNHQPVLGLIYSPIKRLYYYAWQGGGAYKKIDTDSARILSTRETFWQRPVVLTGRRVYSKRVKKTLAMLPSHELKRVNSSIKFGYVAEGSADFYPGVGKTSEWDSAAGQIIIEEAGGKVVDFAGQPLQYNAKEDWENPQFIAVGDPNAIDKWLEILRDINHKTQE